MEIYIEKAFLDEFYLTLSDKSREDDCLLKIFAKYGDVNKYIDVPIESAKELENLKIENPVFAMLCELNPPETIASFIDHVLKNKSRTSKLVFCMNEETWFDKAEKSGCICFSFKNFRKKIESYLNYHINLSFIIDDFAGWHILKPFSCFPNKELYVHDDYILTDGYNQKIDDNLIPIYQNILPSSTKSTSYILTKEFKANPDVPLKRKEKAKKVYNRLKKGAPDNCDFVIYSKKDMDSKNINLHGRTVTSDYFRIYSPKGLNLIPFKLNNEVFQVSTVFDKRTYMELKAELKVYRQWMNKTDSVESHEFKRYPA